MSRTRQLRVWLAGGVLLAGCAIAASAGATETPQAVPQATAQATPAAATAKTAFEEGALAHDLPRVALHPSAAVLEALIEAGFCASKGEARRLAKGGGVRIDDQPVIDVDQPLSGFARDGALIKLSAGKKKIVQVETLPSA